jgi:hypothetical protein
VAEVLPGDELAAEMCRIKEIEMIEMFLLMMGYLGVALALLVWVEEIWKDRG